MINTWYKMWKWPGSGCSAIFVCTFKCSERKGPVRVQFANNPGAPRHPDRRHSCIAISLLRRYRWCEDGTIWDNFFAFELDRMGTVAFYSELKRRLESVPREILEDVLARVATLFSVGDPAGQEYC
jgi:hypothetical protein